MILFWSQRLPNPEPFLFFAFKTMASTKIDELVIELMRESTNLLEMSFQSEEACEVATQSFKEAIDVFHNTSFEKEEL